VRLEKELAENQCVCVDNRDRSGNCLCNWKRKILHPLSGHHYSIPMYWHVSVVFFVIWLTADRVISFFSNGACKSILMKINDPLKLYNEYCLSCREILAVFSIARMDGKHHSDPFIPFTLFLYSCVGRALFSNQLLRSRKIMEFLFFSFTTRQIIFLTPQNSCYQRNSRFRNFDFLLWVAAV
jgi:hypothetical protein